VKTIKLRGQVSQGIVFPLEILPKDKYYAKGIGWYANEGEDVTDILGIKKYDPQAEFERKETERLASIDKNRMDKFLKRYSWYRKLVFRPNRKPFPSFIKKTDEDRIQLFSKYYEGWKDLTFWVTEKIDGQSASYFMVRNPKRGLFRKKWLFGVCSRNFQLLKPDSSSYWTLAKSLDIEKKMRVWCERNGKGLIIQGEAVGDKIQGNKYGYKGVYLFVFNVATYDKGQTTYLPPYKQHMMCSDMGLTPVHLIAAEFKLLPTIADMVQYSTGNSTHNSSVLREGIVVRNYENNISFKVINPDFLLQHSE